MMQRIATTWILIGAAGFLLADEKLADEKSSTYDDASQAAAEGRFDDAVKIATEIIERRPDDVSARLLRAQMYAAQRKHVAAVADYSRILKRRPESSQVYYYRGRSLFCAGKPQESVADFDKYVELAPEFRSLQWERGIALYYAGKYDEGAAQFALYQTYHDNDVENATWRFLCMAKTVGAEQARTDLLPIENDRRVPMMQIYALYRGELTPEEVLMAAAEGNPNPTDLNARLFYAHLYLGLYHEASGHQALARKHILLAEKHKIGHYMWDVAKVHADQLRSQDQ